MFKYIIYILIFLIGCDDREELPYLNLKSLNAANSNLVNEDSYYINHNDS